MDGEQVKKIQDNLVVETKKKEDVKLNKSPLFKEIKKTDNISLESDLTDQIRDQIKQNTEQVPPENIVMATEEKVQDTIFDRNADGVFLPVNGQEILTEAPSKFADVKLADSPGMQLKSAMSDVSTDTKWFGDSEQMRDIKASIKKLEDMGADAAPLDLMVQYDRMIMSINTYLEKNDKTLTFHGSRHRKVRTLLEQLKSARGRLLETDANLGEASLAKRSKEAFEERMKDPGIKELAGDIKNYYLSMGISTDENIFANQKNNILNAYERQLDYYRKIADSFCIRDAAKKKRMDAVHMVEQLSLEKEMIASLTVEKNKMGKGSMTWGDLFNSDYTIETAEIFVDLSDYEKFDNKPTDAYRMLTNLVGGANLFVLGSEKVRYTYTDPFGKVEKMDSYKEVKREGKTLPEIIDLAKDIDLPLMYSDAVLRQLQTIQIIDYILGQTNRNDDSFEAAYTVKNVENVDYLVITDIRVRDHYDSLGTGTPEELNRENAGQSTRQLYNEETFEMNFSDYDPKVADKIIDLDENTFTANLKSIGVAEKNVEAAKKRLMGLKKALQLDKINGNRKLFEDAALRMNKDDKEEDESFRYQKRNFNRERAKYTYIDETLIQDSGETTLLEAKQINRNVDEESDTVKGIIERQNRIRSHIKEDLGTGDKETGLRGRARHAVELVQKYAELGFVSVQTSKSENDPLATLVKKYDNKRFYDMVEEIKNEKGFDIVITGRKKNSGFEDTDLSDIFEFDQNKTLESEKDKEQEEIEKQKTDKELKDAAEKARINRILSDASRDRLMEEEGSKTQYLMHETVKRRREAIDFIKQTISEIKNKKKKTDKDDKTIERLQFYLDIIDIDTTGNLQYDKRDAKRVQDKDLSRDIKFINEKDTPLFMEEPSVRDVCQGGVGDCYFIAALASVVEKDSSFIKNHMKDNGDGTVTVKLYKPGKIYGYNPILVTVDKTSCFSKKGDCGANGCLWVQMYEKAYMASGIRSSFFHRKRYDDIEGGFANEALGYITGKKSKVVLDYTSGKQGGELIGIDIRKTDKKTGRKVYTTAFEKRVAEVKSTLQKHVAKGDIITASSYKRLVGATGSGSSGEEVRRGIAGQHVYTITDMEVIEGKYYVHVRNPWGRSAVETVKNGLTGKSVIRESDDRQRSATYLMEIHDFVEHMKSVTVLDAKEFYKAGKKAEPKVVSEGTK